MINNNNDNNNDKYDPEFYLKGGQDPNKDTQSPEITDSEIDERLLSFDRLYTNMASQNLYNQYTQTKLQDVEAQQAFANKVDRLRGAKDLTDPGVDKVLVDVRNEAGSNEVVLRNIHEGVQNQVKSLNNDEGKTLLGTNRYAGQNFVYDVTGGVNEVWGLQNTAWLDGLLDKMGYTSGERAEALDTITTAFTEPGKVFFNYDTVQDQVANYKDPEWNQESKDLAFATIMANEAGKYLAEQLGVTRASLDQYSSLPAFIYGSNRKYNEAKFAAHAQETMTGGVWDMVKYMGVDVINDPDTIGEIALAAGLAAVSGGVGGVGYIAARTASLGKTTERLIRTSSKVAKTINKTGRILPTRVIGDFIIPLRKAYAKSDDLTEGLNRMQVAWNRMDEFDNVGTFLMGAAGDGLVGGLSAWAMNATTVDTLNEMIYGKDSYPSMWSTEMALQRGLMGVGGAIALGSVIRTGMNRLNAGLTATGEAVSDILARRRIKKLSLDEIVKAESTVTESLVRRTFNEAGIEDEGVIQDVAIQVESAAEVAGVSPSRIAQGIARKIRNIRSENPDGVPPEKAAALIKEAALDSIAASSSTKEARMARYLRKAQMEKAIVAQDLKEIERMEQEDSRARETIQSSALVRASEIGTLDSDKLGEATVETASKLSDEEVDTVTELNNALDEARAELRALDEEVKTDRKKAKEERKRTKRTEQAEAQAAKKRVFTASRRKPEEAPESPEAKPETEETPKTEQDTLRETYSTRESLEAVKGKALAALYEKVFGTKKPSGVKVAEIRDRIFSRLNEEVTAPELSSPTSKKRTRAEMKKERSSKNSDYAKLQEKKKEIIKAIAKKLDVTEETAELLVLQNLKLRSVDREVKGAQKLAKSYKVEDNETMPEAVARSLMSGVDSQYAYEVDLKVDESGYVKVDDVVDALEAAKTRAMGNHLIDLMEDPQSIYFGSRMLRTSFEDFQSRLDEYENSTEETAAVQTIKMRLLFGAKDLTDEDLRKIEVNGKSAILSKDDFMEAALDNAKMLRELFEEAGIKAPGKNGETNFDAILKTVTKDLPTLGLARAELKKLGYSPTVLNSLKADQLPEIRNLIAQSRYVDLLAEAAKSQDLTEEQKSILMMFTDTDFQRMQMQDLLLRIQERIKVNEDSGLPAEISELDALTLLPQISEKLGANLRDGLFGSARLVGKDRGKIFDLRKMEEIASERLASVDAEYNLRQRKAVQEEIDRLEGKDGLNPGERIQLTRFRNKLGVLNGVEFLESEDLPAIREASALRAKLVRNEFIENLGEENGIKAYEAYLDEEESYVLEGLIEALFSNRGISGTRRNEYFKKIGVVGVQTQGKGATREWKTDTAKLILKEALSNLRKIYGPEFSFRQLIDGSEGFFTGRQIGFAILELETGIKLIGDSTVGAIAENKLRKGGREEAKTMLSTERRENAMGNADLRKKVDLLIDYIHRASEHYILYNKDGTPRQLSEEESDAVIDYYENLKNLSDEEIADLVPNLPYEQRLRIFSFTAAERHTNAVRKWFSPKERSERVVERVLAEPPMLHQGIHDDLTFSAIQGSLLSHAGFIGTVVNQQLAFTSGGGAGFPTGAVTPGSVADWLNIRHEAIFKNWSGMAEVSRLFGMAALEDVKQSYKAQLLEQGVSEADAEIASNTVGLAHLEDALNYVDYTEKGLAFDASSQAVALAKAFTETSNWRFASKEDRATILTNFKRSLGWDDETGLLSPEQRAFLLESGLRGKTEEALVEGGLVERVADYYAEVWNYISTKVSSDKRFMDPETDTPIGYTESNQEGTDIREIWNTLFDVLGPFGDKASLDPVQKFIRNKLLKRPVMTRSYGSGYSAMSGAITEFLLEAFTSKDPAAAAFRRTLYEAENVNNELLDQITTEANSGLFSHRTSIYRTARMLGLELADGDKGKGNRLAQALNIPDSAEFSSRVRKIAQIEDEGYRIYGWAKGDGSEREKYEEELDVIERPLTFDDLSFNRQSRNIPEYIVTQENVTALAIREAKRRGWDADTGDEMLNVLGRWYLRNMLYAASGTAEYGQVKRVENELEAEMHRIVTESETPASDLMMLIENFSMRRDELVLRSMNSVNYRPDPDKWDPSLSRHELTREDLPPIFRRSLETGESIHSSVSRTAGRAFTGLGQDSKGWGKVKLKTALDDGSTVVNEEDLKIFHVRRAESNEMVEESKGAGMDLVSEPVRGWFEMDPEERRRMAKQMAAFDLMREFSGTIKPPKLQGEEFNEPTLRDMYRSMVMDIPRQGRVKASMDDLRARALSIQAIATDRTDPLFNAVEGQTTKAIPFTIFDDTVKTDGPQVVKEAYVDNSGETRERDNSLVFQRKISTDMGIPQLQYAKVLRSEEALYRNKLAAAANQEVSGNAIKPSELIVPPAINPQLASRLVANEALDPNLIPRTQTHMGMYRLEDDPGVWQKQIYRKLLDFAERYGIDKEEISTPQGAARLLTRVRAEEALIREVYASGSSANRFAANHDESADLEADLSMATLEKQRTFANMVESAIAEAFEEQFGEPEFMRDKYAGYTDVTAIKNDQVAYPGNTPMDAMVSSAVIGGNKQNADAILGPASIGGIVLGGDGAAEIDGDKIIGLMPKAVFGTDYSIGMGAPEEMMRFAVYYLSKQFPDMPRQELASRFNELWSDRTLDPGFLEKYEAELKKWREGDVTIPEEFVLNNVSSLISIAAVRERLQNDPILEHEARVRWGITVDDLTPNFLEHPSFHGLKLPTEQSWFDPDKMITEVIPREFLDGVGTTVGIDIIPSGRTMWRTLDQFNRGLVNPASAPMVQRMWFASVLEREIEKFDTRNRFDMSVKRSRSFVEHNPVGNSRIERSAKVQEKMFEGNYNWEASRSAVEEVAGLHGKLVKQGLVDAGIFTQKEIDLVLTDHAAWLWLASGGNANKANALMRFYTTDGKLSIDNSKWLTDSERAKLNKIDPTFREVKLEKTGFMEIQKRLAGAEEDSVASLSESIVETIKQQNKGQLKANRMEQIDALLASTGARKALTPEGEATVKEDVIADHIGDASGIKPPVLETESDGLDDLTSAELTQRLKDIKYPGRSKLTTKAAKIAALRESASEKKTLTEAVQEIDQKVAEAEAPTKENEDALERLASVGKDEEPSDPIFQNDDGSPRLLWNESDEIILKKRYPSVFNLLEMLKKKKVFADDLEAQKFAFLLLSNHDVISNILPGIKFSFVGEAGTARMTTTDTGSKGLVSRIEILKDMQGMDAIEAFDIIVHELGHVAVHRAMAANQKTSGKYLTNNTFFTAMKNEFRHRILKGNREDISAFRDAFIAIHGEEKGVEYFQEFVKSFTKEDGSYISGMSEYSVGTQEFIAQLYAWFLLSRADSPEAHPFLKELGGLNEQVGWKIRKMVKAFAGRKILGKKSPMFNDVKLHRAVSGIVSLSNMTGVYHWRGRRTWDSRIFNHPGTYTVEGLTQKLNEISEELKKEGLDPEEQNKLYHMHAIVSERLAILNGGMPHFTRDFLLGAALKTGALSTKAKPSPRRITEEHRDGLIEALRSGENINSNELPLIYKYSFAQGRSLVLTNAALRQNLIELRLDDMTAGREQVMFSDKTVAGKAKKAVDTFGSALAIHGGSEPYKSASDMVTYMAGLMNPLLGMENRTNTTEQPISLQQLGLASQALFSKGQGAAIELFKIAKKKPELAQLINKAGEDVFYKRSSDALTNLAASGREGSFAAELVQTYGKEFRKLYELTIKNAYQAGIIDVQVHKDLLSNPELPIHISSGFLDSTDITGIGQELGRDIADNLLARAMGPEDAKYHDYIDAEMAYDMGLLGDFEGPNMGVHSSRTADMDGMASSGVDEIRQDAIRWAVSEGHITLSDDPTVDWLRTSEIMYSLIKTGNLFLDSVPPSWGAKYLELLGERRGLEYVSAPHRSRAVRRLLDSKNEEEVKLGRRYLEIGKPVTPFEVHAAKIVLSAKHGGYVFGNSRLINADQIRSRLVRHGVDTTNKTPLDLIGRFRPFAFKALETRTMQEYTRLQGVGFMELLDAVESRIDREVDIREGSRVHVGSSETTKLKSQIKELRDQYSLASGRNPVHENDVHDDFLSAVAPFIGLATSIMTTPNWTAAALAVEGSANVMRGIAQMVTQGIRPMSGMPVRSLSQLRDDLGNIGVSLPYHMTTLGYGHMWQVDTIGEALEAIDPTVAESTLSKVSGKAKKLGSFGFEYVQLMNRYQRLIPAQKAIGKEIKSNAGGPSRLEMAAQDYQDAPLDKVWTKKELAALARKHGISVERFIRYQQMGALEGETATRMRKHAESYMPDNEVYRFGDAADYVQKKAQGGYYTEEYKAATIVQQSIFSDIAKTNVEHQVGFGNTKTHPAARMWAQLSSYSVMFMKTAMLMGTYGGAAGLLSFVVPLLLGESVYYVLQRMKAGESPQYLADKFSTDPMGMMMQVLTRMPFLGAGTFLSQYIADNALSIGANMRGADEGFLSSYNDKRTNRLAVPGMPGPQMLMSLFSQLSDGVRKLYDITEEEDPVKRGEKIRELSVNSALGFAPFEGKPFWGSLLRMLTDEWKKESSNPTSNRSFGGTLATMYGAMPEVSGPNKQTSIIDQMIKNVSPPMIPQEASQPSEPSGGPPPQATPRTPQPAPTAPSRALSPGSASRDIADNL